MRGKLLLVLLMAALGCSAKKSTETAERKAPLFDDLGKHHVAITTKSELAQRYFDQGLILAYGFNHAEAGRAFGEAARLDPDCAMCEWGAAYVLGPNINAPMDSAAGVEAYAHAQKALALAPKASEKERAYIEALAKRYAPYPPKDRKPLDVTYAHAMREVARRFPDDLEAATLFAEALMDVTPWDYWTKDGKPQPWTPEIVGTLESVLERAPEHPAAIHFYIHAVEASKQPERAERYADRLGELVPGAGHLVHMPAHIYMRVGRYHDASLANERAGKADESYVTQCRSQGVYPLAYVPHNHHFLWASASMEGRSAEALRAAGSTDAKTNHEMMREPGLGTLQHYSIIPFYAYTRFGKWEEILKAPAPPADLLYPTGLWHYARGRALVATGRLGEAERELAALETIAAKDTLEKVTLWDLNSSRSLLRIATHMLAGELDAKRKDFTAAVRHLREGVQLEDALKYDEPPPWNYPVRQSLGAVLLEAGRAREAERVYREDLEHNPENGWSLFGLMKSLESQGKRAEASEVETRFKKAWTWADVTLTASRF